MTYERSSDGYRGLASAGGARLDQHSVGNLSNASEKLLTGKAVVAAEPTDGLAFAMMAARSPRARKCSAARRMDCSMSACSNSFPSALSFRLPFLGV
jgi:hypothetical protein